MISHKYLNEICSIKTGKRDANHSVLDGQYPFFTCADKPIKSPTYSFDGDSIILPGNGANVGLVLYYSGKFEAYQRTYILSEFKNCNPRYVFHHLRCFWTIANQFMQFGSATNYIRMGNFETYKIPIPPITEQKRIAEILDRTQSLISKRKEAIAKLDTLIQSIFIEMFGDPITNSKGWTIQFLKSFVFNVTNGLTRRRKESDQGRDIVLRLRDIRNGWIDFSDVNRISLDSSERSRYETTVGNLLFIRVNGNPDYVGRCAIFDGFSEPVYFNDHIMRVKIDQSKVNSKFLSFLLNGERGKKEIASYRKTSAGQHTINQEGLNKITIPVPPLPLQKEFAQRVEAVEKLKATHLASLSQLQALFASLQHRAFRGEL